MSKAIGPEIKEIEYIPFDDDEAFNWEWKNKDISLIEKLWQKGVSVWDIARTIDRDPDEVGILLMDRRRKGFIQKRAGGLY